MLADRAFAPDCGHIIRSRLTRSSIAPIATMLKAKVASVNELRHPLVLTFSPYSASLNRNLITSSSNRGYALQHAVVSH